MVDWTDKKRGLIGTPTYPSRTNSLSFNAGQRENLGGLFQTQAFEGSVRIKRFGMYEKVFDSGGSTVSTTNCCNVSELATSPMKCGTTQQLGILTDYAEIGITNACTATRYRWTLALAPGARTSYQGFGSLNTSIITNPIYTAPPCEEEEDAPVLQTTVRISLFCNDVLADYVDIAIKTTLCCPKTIVYETLTMWCGESQTLAPEDYSEECDTALYTWEIETVGGGTFNEQGTGDYTITYNAPECGSSCVNEVVINLYCDDPEHVFPPCDTITITVYPCPKNASITYTTQQMSVGEQQSLGIDKYEGQCGTGASWLWEILSGGGSLSDPTSSSGCTYTAPASNANCEQNPTIALSCDGVVMDTLDIAVNAAGSGAWAFRTWTGKRCQQVAYWLVNVYITNTVYDCSGAVVFGPCEAGAQLSDHPNTVTCEDAWNRIWIAAACGANADTFNNLEASSPVDLRTSAQKAAGCCPLQLL
jgi:hypothetical protein